MRGKGTKLGEDSENIPKIFRDCYVRDNYVWDCYVWDNYVVPPTVQLHSKINEMLLKCKHYFIILPKSSKEKSGPGVEPITPELILGF